MSDRSKPSKQPESDIQRFKNLCKALSEDALQAEDGTLPQAQSETKPIIRTPPPRAGGPPPDNFDAMKKAINLEKSLFMEDATPTKHPAITKPKKN